MESTSVSRTVQRIQASMSPFLEVVLNPANARVRAPEACDFLAGNPQDPIVPGYVEALQRWSVPRRRDWFAYGMPDATATAAAAESLTRRLGLAFSPGDILLARGASGALGLALRAVVDPGDEVIFISPPWFFYEAMILSAGGEPVRVRVDEETFDLDLNAIKAAVTPRTRAIIINTPCNPTGKIYPDETLVALARVLSEASERVGHLIHLISDEAYSPVIFDGHRFATPAAHYPHSLLCHTYSKQLLAPGQRLGWLAMAPSMPDKNTMRVALMTCAISSAIGAPDSIMQYALPEIDALSIDIGRLQRRRDRMVEALREMGYELHVPEATFYLLPRSPVPDSRAFAARLAQRDVFVLPGTAVEMPAHFRISLTATDDMIDRALPVFAEVREEILIAGS
jgi:aspartate aminotransferase